MKSPTAVTGTSRSSRKSARITPKLTVVDQLRYGKRLHQAILDGLQTAIGSADANIFFMTPKMATNLLRFVAMNSELARILIEEGFHPHQAGISFLFEKYCPVAGSTVQIRLAKGYRLEDETEETENTEAGAGSTAANALPSIQPVLPVQYVYEVNPKSETWAALIAGSASQLPTLFDMTEIPRVKPPFKAAALPLMLIWSQSGRNDELGGETITLAVVKPVSIDESRTLMQCEWVEEIGNFLVSTSPSVTPILPVAEVAPSLEPQIVPRSPGNGPGSRSSASAHSGLQPGNLTFPDL